MTARYYAGVSQSPAINSMSSLSVAASRLSPYSSAFGGNNSFGFKLFGFHILAALCFHALMDRGLVRGGGKSAPLSCSTAESFRVNPYEKEGRGG